MSAYDGIRTGFAHLDGLTLTCWAVRPAHTPDVAHLDLSNVLEDHRIGSDTATATLDTAAGVLDVEDVSIDLDGDTAVGWLIWVDPDDNLVRYEAVAPGEASDPLEVTYPSGLLRGTQA